MKEVHIEKSVIPYHWTFETILPEMPFPLTTGFNVLCQKLNPFGLSPSRERVLFQATFGRQNTDFNRKSISNQEPNDSFIKIKEVLKRIQELGVCIPFSFPVEEYLFHYPDLIESILPICEIVKTKFKESTNLSLELYRDKEGDDSYLTIYVRQKEYGKTIINEIDEIFSQYELYLFDKKGWIIVTTDFRPSM